MKQFLLLLILIAIGCSNQSAREKTYLMTATIVSRDPAANTVNLDNKEVPGEMAAMKMDYQLRGAKVSSLPPDGTAVVVTVHDRGGHYFVTDVKVMK
jgi:Copper binding periplasmic protein CusF